MCCFEHLGQAPAMDNYMTDKSSLQNPDVISYVSCDKVKDLSPIHFLSLYHPEQLLKLQTAFSGSRIFSEAAPPELYLFKVILCTNP